MNPNIKAKIISIQKEEIEGYSIYRKLAAVTKDRHNAEILERISGDELKHYKTLKRYTSTEVKPSRLRILYFVILARVMGLTFSLKLMERGEHNAGETYSGIGKAVPEVEKILRDEDRHETKLIGMIDEERLKYVGSIVLGLSDALVELTGVLAGFTFAIQNTRTIAFLGLITGIAATLSMAASEFLSQSHENESDGINPLKSSIYTGIAYIITVILLVLPFFLTANPYFAMCIMLSVVIAIIFFFNFYISIARDQSFFKGFIRMAIISLSVALISFAIGYFVKVKFGFDM
jgi:vacuolar iron transporter family protein